MWGTLAVVARSYGRRSPTYTDILAALRSCWFMRPAPFTQTWTDC